MRRLLCDAMLGKLATYLRMCEYDTAYALDRDLEDDDALLEWARDEGRTILTRSRELADRAPDAIEVSAHDPADQLADLREAGLEVALPDEPGRCSQCNGELTRVDDEEPRPDYAPPPAEQPVWRCPDCGQHYWRGSHWADLRETLSDLERG